MNTTHHEGIALTGPKKTTFTASCALEDVSRTDLCLQTLQRKLSILCQDKQAERLLRRGYQRITPAIISDMTSVQHTTWLLAQVHA
jgi:hypothetical protein